MSFLLVFAEEAAFLELAGESDVRHTAAHHQISVDVTHTLPRVDGGEVRRLFGSGKPLRYREIGGSTHPDLSAAPLLLCEPLDEIVAIAAILSVPQQAVAFAVHHPTDIRIADRVALSAPVRRVCALELFQTRDDPVGQAPQGEYTHHAQGGSLAFAVRTPRHDDRHLLCPDRTEHVGVDRHAVTQLDRDILLENDFDRQ